MLLPDLSTLSLSPPDVADVGAHGDQCDPRDQAGGLCVVLVPMPYLYNVSSPKLPRDILNDDEMTLLHESAKAVKEVADVLDGMGV